MNNRTVREVVNFYYVTFCHELAHNIVSEHDEEFVSELQKAVLYFMDPKDLFLQKFSFADYMKALV